MNRLLQIMGPPGEDGLDLAQDARVLVSRLVSGNGVSHSVAEDRGAYLYVIAGALALGDDKLGTGDAAKIYGAEGLDMTAVDDSELILIEAPLRFRVVGVWAGVS